MPDLPCSLYIHVPWCVRKCPYCDFNSHERDDMDEDAYITALIDDLDAELRISGEPDRWASIFIGGGTPSLLSAAAYERLLTAIDARVGITSDIEITIEANPGTAEAGRFKGYRDAGINRISLGFQSLDDGSLARLGRIHSAAEATNAFIMAREAGFENINVDLMFGLPDQDADAMLRDLKRGIALEPEHLSWYQLTIEPNTHFHRYPPLLPAMDQVAETQVQGEALLVAAGFDRYEISAYARAGRQCRHNLNYWQFGDYIGIGAGAHGKRSLADGVSRTNRTRLPRHYLASRKRQQQDVSRDELPLEFLMNALRLRRGFTLQEFTATTGLSSTVLDSFVREGVARELLDKEGDRLRASEQGYRFLDSLLLLA